MPPMTFSLFQNLSAMALDWQVLWNQLLALALNLRQLGHRMTSLEKHPRIWFIRQVLPVPGPAFGDGTTAQIVGPGGERENEEE